MAASFQKNDFQNCPPDSRAVDFLRAELHASPALGGYLEDLDFELGKLAALVPTPFRPSLYGFRASIHEYASDSICDGLQRVVSVEDALYAFLRRYFLEFPMGLFLTESFLLRRADLLIAQGLPASTFSHCDAVFFAATAESSEEETRSAAQSLFQSPFGLGVLTTPPSLGNLGEDLVVAAARHVDAVLLGAYDGEGLLIWTRQSLSDNVLIFDEA